MKNILVTGVSSGIGKGIAKYFIEQKVFRVFGTVRKNSDGDQLKRSFGENFIPIKMDAQNIESINKAYSILKTECPSGLNLLVNNAGIAVSGPLKDLPIEDFEKQMDVNVNGIVRVTNIFSDLLGASLESKFKPGKIINIGSVSGLFNSPFLGAYCISKHAVESISDIYRRELSIYGIKVVCIEPGPIKSDIWAKATIDKDKFLHTDYKNIWKGLMKRVEKSEKNALPNEVLAKKIYRINNMTNPAPRYIVTKGKFVNWLFLYLVPNRIADFFIHRTLIKAIKK